MLTAWHESSTGHSRLRLGHVTLYAWRNRSDHWLVEAQLGSTVEARVYGGNRRGARRRALRCLVHMLTLRAGAAVCDGLWALTMRAARAV